MLSRLTEIPRMQLGEFVLTIELDDLSPELQQVALKELRENPDIVKPAIEELRTLLKDDAELNVPYENDGFLVRFLRPCKYYAESAYQLVKRYYQFKVKHHKVYDGLLPSTEQNIFAQNILTVLPTRDAQGRQKWKPSECSLDEVFKGCVLFVEAAVLEPKTQVAGAQVIFDMDGLSLSHVCQFTPPFAKRIVDWLQPYIFNMVFALFKPFLREKLRSRIIFHGKDRASLHKHINREALLPCYDGLLDVPRISGIQWFELLQKCDDEYKAINSYGVKSANGEIIKG
ncbi:hypothetical protein B566_EDAN001869 [Ephemera danica]|nr:hypothetical protein B566_EDAN001869 [Ephemera danica]